MREATSAPSDVDETMLRARHYRPADAQLYGQSRLRYGRGRDWRCRRAVMPTAPLQDETTSYQRIDIIAATLLPVPSRFDYASAIDASFLRRRMRCRIYRVAAELPCYIFATSISFIKSYPPTGTKDYAECHSRKRYYRRRSTAVLPPRCHMTSS